MNDDEWNKRRDRAIRGAFQTGRAVFADSDGVQGFADGNCEPLAAGLAVSRTNKTPESPAERVISKTALSLAVKPSWWGRMRWWMTGAS